MTPIAVLGAAGFIGRHVVSELVRRGHAVHAYDRAPGANQAGVTWHALDLDAAVPRGSVSVAIHLAEPAVPTESHAALCEGRLRRVLAADFARVIYVSSAVVYGDRAAAPCAETAPTPAPGAYAQAKLATETLAAADPRCTIVRLANTYGAGMGKTNVLSDILAQLGGEGPLRVRDLAPVRDYIHVSDVARALAMLVEHSGSTLFNVGSGVATSVEQLARAACAASGAPDRQLEATQPAGGSSYLVLDATRASRELGWRPTITLETGLADLVKERMS